MAMFGKAKEQYEFVKKAREAQKKLRGEIVEAEKGLIKVKMNGEMKVQSVEILAEEVDDVRQLEKEIKEAMDSVTDKAQKVAAAMMKDVMGDMGGGMPF